MINLSSKLLCTDGFRPDPTDFWFCQPESDPFSHGAYSYGKAGREGAQQALGLPVEDRLFFAGEATDVSGHNGTVHRAFASGLRAAAEIAKSRS